MSWAVDDESLGTLTLVAELDGVRRQSLGLLDPAGEELAPHPLVHCVPAQGWLTQTISQLAQLVEHTVRLLELPGLGGGEPAFTRQ